MKFGLILSIFSAVFLTACLGISSQVEQPPAGITNPTRMDDEQEINPDAQSHPEITATTVVTESGGMNNPYPGPALTAQGDIAATQVPYPPSEDNTADNASPSSQLVINPADLAGYRVLNTYPHDTAAYTQGLIVAADPNYFLEGTGLWQESSLRRVKIDTGEVVQFLPMPPQEGECAVKTLCSEDYWGEGITVLDDKLYQLTWKSGDGLIYDPVTFAQTGEFTYQHEGWGITHDGQRLIVSDGSNILHFWDPAALTETKAIAVTYNGQPVYDLNELEYVNGEILANVWFTDLIARISPETGNVIGWIDLSGLLPPDTPLEHNDVLNGIAYDQQNDRLYVTGKRWPLLFEIEVVPVQ